MRLWSDIVAQNSQSTWGVAGQRDAIWVGGKRVEQLQHHYFTLLVPAGCLVDAEKPEIC